MRACQSPQLVAVGACPLDDFRLAEGLEYRDLLDQAAKEPNSVDRLMLVSVWNLTCYASQVRLAFSALPRGGISISRVAPHLLRQPGTQASARVRLTSCHVPLRRHPWRPARWRSAQRMFLAGGRWARGQCVCACVCVCVQALRDCKPFNPLLGETFEWQSHDGDAR